MLYSYSAGGHSWDVCLSLTEFVVVVSHLLELLVLLEVSTWGTFIAASEIESSST